MQAAYILYLPGNEKTFVKNHQMSKQELLRIIKLPLDQFREKIKDWELITSDEAPDLTGASLSEADLRGKNLQSFVLERADLHHADLSGANLSSANLKGANLSHCNLENCDLSGCVLEGANLSFAVLKNVKWEKTILKDANLQGACIEQDIYKGKETDRLQHDQLEQACNWPLAKYDESLLADPHLPFSTRGIGIGHNDRLAPENLDLSEYDLSNVNLKGAKLSNFKLKQTNLQGAILNGAEGLDARQLEEARNWPLAYYDDSQLASLRLPFRKRNIGPGHNERLRTENLDLSGYDLSNVNLRYAKLAHFRLAETNLQGATLRKATGLTKEQIEEAVNWPFAHYDPDQLKELGFPKDHHTRLQSKNLSRYNLSGVVLKGANLGEFHLNKTVLTGAQLEGANLHKALLIGADLEGANLQHTNLANAYLIEANLEDANLQGANLQRADLTRAHLQRANFSASEPQSDETTGGTRDRSPRSTKGANLYQAILKDAFLEDANLETATGLVSEQLTGASVAGTILPKAIDEKLKKLEYIKESSRYSKNLFFILLLGCLYALLTIASTTDAQLVNSSASLELPIFNVEVSVVPFYFLAPFLLIGAYFVFNLSLQRLWEKLAKLPAILPDGTPLDEIAHPWLLMGLVRSKVFQLRSKENRPLLVAQQNFLFSFLAWGVVPLTLTIFWWRYLSRHDWFWTVVQLVLIASAITMAVFFRRVAGTTLRGKEIHERKKKIIGKHALIGFSYGLLILATSFFLSYGAIEGIRPGYDIASEKESTADVLKWLPWTYAQVHLNPFAELKDEELSQKPEAWTENSDPVHVKGASLQGRDLRYGNFKNAFLVKADLSNANLSKADLSGTDLRLANLTGADLEGANLLGANLAGADLNNVKGLSEEQLLAIQTDQEAELPLQDIASLPEGEPAKPDLEAAPPTDTMPPAEPAPTKPPSEVPMTAKADREAAPPADTMPPSEPAPTKPPSVAPMTAKADLEAAPPADTMPPSEPEPAKPASAAPVTAKADRAAEPPPDTMPPPSKPEPTKPASAAPVTAKVDREAEPPPDTMPPPAKTEPMKKASEAPVTAKAVRDAEPPPDTMPPPAKPEPTKPASEVPMTAKAVREAEPPPDTMPPPAKPEPTKLASEAPMTAKANIQVEPSQGKIAVQAEPEAAAQPTERLSKDQGSSAFSSRSSEMTSGALELGNGHLTTQSASIKSQDLSQLAALPPIRLTVFTKPIDGEKVISALRPLGYDMLEIASKVPGNQTNMIWFGELVEEKDIRRVALALVCAEVTIKGIAPFPKKNKPSTIEIGFNKYFEPLPLLSLTEVQNMELAAIPSFPNEEFTQPGNCP